MPSLLLTYCFPLMYVCTPAHTNTPIFTTTRRGGSLELATITVCIVAYSLCLTGHTTSALLLSPVHCLLHQRPCKDTHTITHWSGGGAVSTHAGLQKTFTGCQFAFCSPKLTMLRPFLESQSVECRTCSFCVSVIQSINRISLPPLYRNTLVGQAAFSFRSVKKSGKQSLLFHLNNEYIELVVVHIYHNIHIISRFALLLSPLLQQMF